MDLLQKYNATIFGYDNSIYENFLNKKYRNVKYIELMITNDNNHFLYELFVFYTLSNKKYIDIWYFEERFNEKKDKFKLILTYKTTNEYFDYLKKNLTMEYSKLISNQNLEIIYSMFDMSLFYEEIEKQQLKEQIIIQKEKEYFSELKNSDIILSDFELTDFEMSDND